MFNRLKKLIEQHYYSTAEEAKEKVSVLYSYGKLTKSEYETLMELIEEEYGNN